MNGGGERGTKMNGGTEAYNYYTSVFVVGALISFLSCRAAGVFDKNVSLCITVLGGVACAGVGLFGFVD